LKTLTHRHAEGWLGPLPSELDSPGTLVMAVGASDYAQHPGAFDELAAAFPQWVLMGCSTSGEIVGSQAFDASISVAVARFSHTQLRRVLNHVADPADSRAAGESALPRNCPATACARCSTCPTGWR